MTGGPPGARPRSALVRAYAQATTRFWWAPLLAVAAALWVVVSWLPGLGAVSGSGLSILDEDAAAVTAQARAVELFGLPLLTRVAVVQHDPAGLEPQALERAVRRARAASGPVLSGHPTSPLLFALPVANGLPGSLPTGLVPDAEALGPAFPASVPSPPGLAGPTTTIVTYLFVDPTLPPGAQAAIARSYADGIDRPGDHLSGISGTIPVPAGAGAGGQRAPP